MLIEVIDLIDSGRFCLQSIDWDKSQLKRFSDFKNLGGLLMFREPVIIIITHHRQHHDHHLLRDWRA